MNTTPASPVQLWLAETDLTAFRRLLLRWYRSNGRDLPWRRKPSCDDPYRVLVSEIMLQQTQVATVLRYFDRFLDRFPNVESLAAADETDVLHAWQGLGYYRRARNLHRAARYINELLQGKFPKSAAELQELPGIGRYIAAAVASIARDEPAGILEANTIRLWTRLTASPGDPARSPLQGQLWEIANQVLPQKGAGDVNQALMDLGSMICSPKAPACSQCPVRQFCRAAALATPESFPQLAARPVAVNVDHVAVVIWAESRVLVIQRPSEGRWANLWEFPRVEVNKRETPEMAALRAIETVAQIPCRLLGPRCVVHHGIMNEKVRLQTFEAIALSESGTAADPKKRWTRPGELAALPLSSPQRRIANALLDRTGPIETEINTGPSARDRKKRRGR